MKHRRDAMLEKNVHVVIAINCWKHGLLMLVTKWCLMCVKLYSTCRLDSLPMLLISYPQNVMQLLLQMKKSKKMLPLEILLEVIKRVENGEGASELIHAVNMESSIWTVRRNVAKSSVNQSSSPSAKVTSNSPLLHLIWHWH